MQRRQLAPIAMLFIVAIGLLLFYQPKTEFLEIVGQAQGTYYKIKYEDRPSRNLKGRIEQHLHKFDLSLSIYDSTSIISRVNRNEENLKLDKYFLTVFNKSEEIYHVSNGAFDITVGPLVNAWGFGVSGELSADSSKIDSILQFIGMDKVVLENGKIKKSHPSVQLDVNAIAQGYSVDVIAAFLERKGIKNYLIDIGGEIKAKGVNHKGAAWRIGIDKPIENNYSRSPENVQAVFSIINKSLATSGNYRKFHEKNGVKYSHSINPKTGYPVMSKLLSATVIAENCMSADAFATAFMVMGLEKSILFLSKHKELDAYLIYSDDEGNFKTFVTPNFKKLLVDSK